MDNADIAAAGKEGLGPLGQRGVELDRRDFAARADQLGQDRAIIAGPGADMDDVASPAFGPRASTSLEWSDGLPLLTPRAGSRAMTRS
jgi:hypothetical protein